MNQWVRIIADCDAVRAPYMGSERLHRVARGSTFVLLRDEDRDYYKVACVGVPAYVPKAASVRVEDASGSSPEATAVAIGALTGRSPLARAGTKPKGGVSWLRVAAGVLALIAIALALLVANTGCEPGDGICEGYSALFGFLIFIIGGFFALLLLAVSFVIGPSRAGVRSRPGELRTNAVMRWARPVQRTLLIVSASLFVTAFLRWFLAGGLVDTAMAASFWAGLIVAFAFVAALAWPGPYSATGSRDEKR